VLPRAQRGIFALLALGIPLSGYDATYPENTWLQVGPVALALALGWWALTRRPLSNLSVAAIGLFVALHLLAAHWSYSFVPYRDWLGLAEGGRNQFDRLVHFLFGLLFTLPLVELARRYLGQGRAMALLFAFLAIQATSAVYEIFEWALALTIAPDAVEAYNGQQGDIFDAQKDMAMALLGNLLALVPGGMRKAQ
jgi:putative membrane protein